MKNIGEIYLGAYIGEYRRLTGRPEQMKTLGLMASTVLERFFCDFGVAKKISSDSESLSGTFVLLGDNMLTSLLIVDVLGTTQFCNEFSYWSRFVFISILLYLFFPSFINLFNTDDWNLRLDAERGHSAAVCYQTLLHRRPWQLLGYVWSVPVSFAFPRSKDSLTEENLSNSKVTIRCLTLIIRLPQFAFQHT